MSVSQSIPTDPYELLHFHMVRAHDTFKLGYDRIIELLDSPPTHDLDNFLGYCEAWASSIEEHHNSEEAVVFPFLNTKMDFSGEAEAHKGIHASLHDVIDIIHHGRANPAEFNPRELQDLMENLREPLYAHLDDEVKHVSADEIRNAGFSGQELLKMVADLAAYARANANPFLQVPYMRSHTPPEFKDCWPGMPWFVRNLIIPYVLAWRYSGYWKYSPYPVS